MIANSSPVVGNAVSNSRTSRFKFALKSSTKHLSIVLAYKEDTKPHAVPKLETFCERIDFVGGFHLKIFVLITGAGDYLRYIFTGRFLLIIFCLFFLRVP